MAWTRTVPRMVEEQHWCMTLCQQLPQLAEEVKLSVCYNYGKGNRETKGYIKPQFDYDLMV